MMQIAEGLKRRIPRTIRGRVLAVLAIYISLVVAESLFLSKIVDPHILAKLEIFEDYVARLPKPFVFPDPSKINFTNCEYHAVALAYRFEICAMYAGQLPGCARPNYTALYVTPTRYLNPLRATLVDRASGGISILQFDSALSICHSYLE